MANQKQTASWEARTMYDPLILAFAASLTNPEHRTQFEQMDYDRKCRLIHKAFERGIMRWGQAGGVQ